jgi:hypothetical protein
MIDKGAKLAKRDRGGIEIVVMESVTIKRRVSRGEAY